MRRVNANLRAQHPVLCRRTEHIASHHRAEEYRVVVQRGLHGPGSVGAAPALGAERAAVLVVAVSEVGFEAGQPDHGGARHLERVVELFLHQLCSQFANQLFDDELREVDALA